MNLRILGAVALVLAATGHAQADGRTAAAAATFHAMTKSACGFNMTTESAMKAASTFGMTAPGLDSTLSAMFAVCAEMKKGNKGKTIEIQARDNRNVLRKVTLEKAKWWQ
jgi:hypothetical protein